MEFCVVTITLRAEVSLLHGFSLYIYEVVPFARPLQQCFHLILFVIQQFPIRPSEGVKASLCIRFQKCSVIIKRVEFRRKSEGFPQGQRKLSTKTKFPFKRLSQ